MLNENSNSGPITAQAREAQIDAIFSKARELPQTDGAVYLAQVRDFMVTQPDVVEAASSESAAWAFFRDGEPIFVSISRGTAGVAPRVAEPRAKAELSPLADAPSELPSSRNACLINLFQSGNNAFQTSTPKVSRILNQVGYQSRELSGSLADYKGLGGGVGVLYVDGHGEVVGKSRRVSGSAVPLGEDVFGLETAELVPTKDGHTDLSRETLGNDLKVGANGEPPAVIRGLVNEDLNGAVQRGHYFITATFVDRYMSNFADHSLVFLNTCYSTHPAAEKFRASLAAKKMATYMGWSLRVDDGDAARFGPQIMDRLLGANAGDIERPEIPAQRPFPVDPVLIWFGTPITRLAGVLQKSGENVVLAPSIQKVDVTDQHHLVLHGKFGSNSGGDGEVRLGQVVLPYESADWQLDTIKVSSEEVLNEGEVEVRVHGVKSNRVPLTIAYNCEVSFNPNRLSRLASRSTGGAFSEIITEDIHSFTASLGTLADRHGYREVPGGPVLRQAGLAAASPLVQITSAEHSGTITYKAGSGGAPQDAVQDILMRPNLSFPFYGSVFSRQEGNGIVYVSIVGSSDRSVAHYPRGLTQPPDYAFPLLVGGVGNVTTDSNGVFQGQDYFGTPDHILFTPRQASVPEAPDSVPR